MWNPADCNAMTGTQRPAGLAPGKVWTAAGLTDGLLPVWMLDRVCGKNIAQGGRVAFGHGSYEGADPGWSTEMRQGNGIYWPDLCERGLDGEKSRNSNW